MAQLDTVVTSQFPKLMDRFQHQLGIGGVGHVLGLHRGVDRDPGQVVPLQGAGVMRQAQALLEKQVELVADPPAPVRQPRALVWEGVLEELLAGEVLEIGIINPALAHALIRQVEDVLEDQQADHEARLGARPALVAEPIGQLLVEPVPVGFVRQAHQFVIHVDDLVEPGAEQVA